MANEYLNGDYKPRKKRFVMKMFLVIVVILFVGAVAGGLYAKRWYDTALSARSTSADTIVVTIPEGSSIKEIAELLESKKVIRNARAFDWYMRSRPDRDAIQAGTYEFSQSYSVKEIGDKLVAGEIAKNLFTVLPGSRIDQIRQNMLDTGFTKESIDAAFNPETYKDHPALVDKPDIASLEGYIYPDSYEKTAETTPTSIIKLSLDEMNKYLTPDLRRLIAKQGLSIHEGITLASVVEREVSSDEDRAIVAQVFYKRLKEDIPLGADATFFYAAAITGETASPELDNPYNTRMYKGLPPGPISNVSKESLQAIANPADTDYLFFVSGDDGVTHFTKTQEEHESATEKYCKKNCELPE